MEVTFNINGYAGIAVIPDGLEKKKTIIAFHGFGGQAAGFKSQVKLEQIATDMNIIYFSAPLRDGEYYWKDADNTDVHAILAVLVDLAQTYPIDLRLLFAFGYSNGAFFSHYLMKKFKRTIKGAVVVNGALQLGAGADYDKTVIAINSGKDEVVVNEGGIFPTRSFHSMVDTARIYEEGGANFKQLFYASAPHNLNINAGEPTSLKDEMANVKDDMTAVMAGELMKL